MKLVRILAIVACSSTWVLAPASAQAFDLEQSLRELQAQHRDTAEADFSTTQKGSGKSLSEAVSEIRRKTKGQILSAETKMKGDREIHHIKVLTKDGKVKTHKVQGRKRGG